jgi:hypothetical protein
MLHVQNYVVLRCTKRNKQLTQKTLSLSVQIDLFSFCSTVHIWTFLQVDMCLHDEHAYISLKGHAFMPRRVSVNFRILEMYEIL